MPQNYGFTFKINKWFVLELIRIINIFQLGIILLLTFARMNNLGLKSLRFPKTKSVVCVSSISLVYFLLSVAISPVIVHGFETETTGFVPGPLAFVIGHIGDPIHQQITHSAFDAFMKSSAVNDINHGHEVSDFTFANQFDSSFHFDGSQL